MPNAPTLPPSAEETATLADIAQIHAHRPFPLATLLTARPELLDPVGVALTTGQRPRNWAD